jgi:RNA polymerase sigma-70 factor (ECF subfamily)
LLNTPISQEIFTQAFQACKPQLRSFILRMTASVEDTEDLLQDTFIQASEHLEDFLGKSALKTWIFTIAANLSKNLLRANNRWPDNATDLAREATMRSPAILSGFMQVHQESPHGAFEIREHINFCFTCVGKTLPIEEQIAVLLKEVYAFKVVEIAQIMEMTEGSVKHRLYSARQTMMAVFDKRCALINKKGTCHQCSELNGLFNPRHETQKQLMQIDMVKHARTKTKEALFALRTGIVRSIDPYDGQGCALQLFHLRHVKNTMENIPVH